MTEMYKKAMHLWGMRIQAVIMIEEMAELTKELCKYLRHPENIRIKELTEEWVDVELMMQQLRVFIESHPDGIDLSKYWLYEKQSKLKKYIEKEEQARQSI